MEAVRERAAAAESRAGRAGGSVHLLAVTKRVEPERIREAAAAGITSVGENYVQEAQAKRAALDDLPLEWRLIGRLQTNKAGAARKLFGMIETVDRVEVAEALCKGSPAGMSRLDVLVQVSLAPGEGRSGVSPEQISPLLERVLELDGLRLRGLMGVPLPSDDPSATRSHFRALRNLWEDLGRQMDGYAGRVAWDTLSMGMSGDFEIAIEEGSTSVRIGRAIFGERAV
ncbi:MAG: YggS family pyridoxal phosphate-dependent enzyme [Armatimonadota bacterium]|nr:YggS family pyridoxal phosphate-dependent enzyme [Armatimonadota bacterium]